MPLERPLKVIPESHTQIIFVVTSLDHPISTPFVRYDPQHVIPDKEVMVISHRV